MLKQYLQTDTPDDAYEKNVAIFFVSCRANMAGGTVHLP